MFGSFLTIAIRNLSRHRLYAAINIIGLAVGLAFFSLLFILVKHELSYDTQHEKSGRIYRVIEFLEKDGIGEKSASMPFPFATNVKKAFPEYVEATTRIFNFQAPSYTVEHSGKRYSEAKFYFADTSFFTVFDYPLEIGDAATVLREANTVLLSHKKAKQYFGSDSPIGQKIVYEGRDSLTVRGVFAPVQNPSHFDFDFIASFDVIESAISSNTIQRNWIWNPCWTYVVLQEGKSPEDLEYLFDDFVNQHFTEYIKNSVSLYLQPLEEIHLNSALDYELSQNGDIQYVYIFGAIALLLLAVASINFINLSTARSSTRAKEVGVRKAIGAHRIELLGQFFVEFLLISLIAIFIAMVMVELLLPSLSFLTARNFDFGQIPITTPLAIVGVTGLVIGSLSSIYPAYYLTGFSPTKVLKGALGQGIRGKQLRSSLVVVQFIITLFLMICTLVSFKQYEYLSEHPLGFEQKGMIILPVANTPLSDQFDQFKRELLKSGHISNVTGMDEVMGKNHQTHQFKRSEEEQWTFFPSLIVREDFIQTFDIELLMGRPFKAGRNDEAEAIIINEKMVSHLGWTRPRDAMGKTIYMPDGQKSTPKKIIGVMADFHFESLHKPVTPFALAMTSDRFMKRWATRYIAIRIKHIEDYESIDEHPALIHIEKVWREYLPNRVFEYFHLSDTLDQQYIKEKQMGAIAADFAIIAIFLACLGLFGLSSFVMEQRKKEIAIRKAMGISDGEVVILLSEEFLKLVGIAILIAWPLSYALMESWLATFPFQASMDFFTFLFSGALAIGITLITISYHTFKAARSNPVDAL